MATATTKTARKTATSAAAGGAKSASTKTKAAAAPAAEEEDPEAAAAAAAEREAAEAQKNEQLIDLKGRLTDTIHNLREGDKKSAEQARLDWVEIGRMLNEGRALFTKGSDKGGNQTDEKGFGKWLVENGFTLLGQRPTRAGAAWLANVYDMKPALYALFPTESVDGEPLRRSPRTLQAWVREQVYEAFQDAFEADRDGIEIAADIDGTKEQKKDAAKATMPNVYAALREQMDAADAQVTAKEKALKEAKTPAQRKSASDDYVAVCGHRDRLATRKEIMDQHNEGEMLSLFIGWRPKVQSVAYKDLAPEEAAARLFALLKQHGNPGAVYDSLGDMVDALLAKTAADEGAVEGDDAADEGATMNDPEGDADFEVEDDSADEGEFEVEEDDNDDEFESDVDEAFEEGEE